jgi:hypothetical protein
VLLSTETLNFAKVSDRARDSRVPPEWVRPPSGLFAKRCFTA